ncbi:MAG: M24 family metallopeptidase [Desulfatiglandaceae bacterium]
MEIENSIFIDRLEKLKVKIQRKNLKAIVVYSTGSALGFSSRTHGYLKYLCNWDSLNRASMLVLMSERDPVMLVNGRSAKLFAKENLWIEDIRAVSPDNFGKEIVTFLKPLLKESDGIGYVGKAETPVGLYNDILDGLPKISLMEADYIINEERVIKDDIDITLHRTAAAVCDDMFDTFCKEVRSGKRVYQIQADLEHTARSQGCEYASTFMTVAPVVDRPRYYKEECLQIPEEGDQVLLSLFALKDGHWGHSIRTGSLGKAGAELQEIYGIVSEMHQAALGEIYPGNRVSEIWEASERVLKKYYPKARDSDWYWLKTGHSLGLDYSDPILSDFFPNPFKMNKESLSVMNYGQKFGSVMSGMLFEIHPNLFVPGYAAAAIGNMVLSTNTGYQILDKYPISLMVV